MVKCPKTVKVTLTVTRDVGTVLRVTKQLFVFIRQQCILKCNSVHIPQ